MSKINVFAIAISLAFFCSATAHADNDEMKNDRDAYGEHEGKEKAEKYKERVKKHEDNTRMTHMVMTLMSARKKKKNSKIRQVKRTMR